MAQIFISYSRADAQFISDLVPLLHEAYGVASVFYDEQIPGGTKWWEIILGEIAACDLFVYLCSNDSLQSPYCQSELREAVRLQKQILPAIVRPRTNYPFAGVDYGTTIPDDIAVILSETNCIDLSRGFRDRELGPKAGARLYGAINKALENAPSRQGPPLTPYPIAQPHINDKERSRLNEPRAIIIAAVITGMFAIVAVIIPLISNGQNASWTQETLAPTFSPPPTTQEITSEASFPSITPTPTIAPSTQMSTSTSSDPEVTINVASANLRRGPGLNYSVVGAASQNEQLRVIARTSDSTWYLVVHPGHGDVWIANSVVTLNVLPNRVSVVVTIPPTEELAQSIQAPTVPSNGIWSTGTIVRLGCANVGCTWAQMSLYSACNGGTIVRTIEYNPGDQIYATVQNYSVCGINARMYEVVMHEDGTRAWILASFVMGP